MPRLTAAAWVAIGVSVALCLHYLVLARDAYLLDLDVYREAVDVAWSGGDVYAGLFTDIRLPYLYPPFAILFLTPIAALSDVSAQVVWTAVTLAAIIIYAAVCVSNFAAQRFHTPTVYAVTIAFALAMEPTESGFNFGQINILLALFMVLDLSARTGRLPQGVLTGLAAAVKLTPLLVAVYFLVTKRVRSGVTTIVTFLAASAVAAVVFPQASWIYWTGTFLESDRVGVAYISNQSINGLLQRQLGDTQIAQVAWLALAALVVVGTMIMAHHLFTPYPHLTDALTLAAILLVSPISWTAHWILILPLLLVAALPDRPVVWLQASAGLLAAALLYGVVRPQETAQILAEPKESQLIFGNTFTWLTLLVGFACVFWYWSRTSEPERPR
ncbi:MAG: glycosyltransferase 87 family protein [Candidatus Nanopelagicales bacterium]|nr:glycosyltransferase 87 family protein [Candidatus Nanopelagicales bacterium]MCU0297386.1 glycosyltransferase 87 family protein [Candidatus Nanopelagicales bacterium]